MEGVHLEIGPENGIEKSSFWNFPHKNILSLSNTGDAKTGKVTTNMLTVKEFETTFFVKKNLCS